MPATRPDRTPADARGSVEDLIRRYWRALDARDWEALAETLAEDVVYELPQTRERVRGRAAYLDFNATFPGDWHLRPLRLVVDASGAAGKFEFLDGDLRLTAITFFDVAGGAIERLEEYWPEPYDPPARASRHVERDRAP